MVAKAVQTKPLDRWRELNDRQQGTLAVIYEMDQENDRNRRANAADGYYDRRPAAEWRAIDFAHDPGDRRLFGTTELQNRLAAKGWDNQGNGSTMAALSDRELITRSGRPTSFGVMLRVALTRSGRAAAKAGLSLATGPARKAALSPRAWELLAKLWMHDQAGTFLDWRLSTTIENVLIRKHVPPLAEHGDHGRGYRITERGRWFYREHYAAHAAAHPAVRAPHPDGAEAEPWPPEVDAILAQHRQRYEALCAGWHQVRKARAAAEAEVAAEAPTVPAGLPEEVAALATIRHTLWCDTARQRAQLAAEHETVVGDQAQHAARAYAEAALVAFRAAVTGTDPRAGLVAPGPKDDWDEQRLAPPAETGIPVIDEAAVKLHAAATGAPRKRRGPAPKHRPSRFATAPAEPPAPGTALAALAKFLHDHVHRGELLRRLHPDKMAAGAPQ